MREDDITGISQEFDLALSRIMPPRGKGAQERDMEMANHQKSGPTEKKRLGRRAAF